MRKTAAGSVESVRIIKGPRISLTSAGAMDGIRAVVIWIGSMRYATKKKVMISVRLHMASEISCATLSSFPSVTYSDNRGKMAVAIEAANSEYGRMYSVKAFW